MDKILHNGRCLLPNWHIGHHVNLTFYRLLSSIATAKQVLHVFDHHQSEKTMSEAVWAQEVGQNPQEVLSLRHFLPPHYHFRHLLQLFWVTADSSETAWRQHLRNLATDWICLVIAWSQLNYNLLKLFRQLLWQKHSTIGYVLPLLIFSYSP